MSSCNKDATQAVQPRVAAASSSNSAVAVNGVMMQGFYWDVPRTTPAGTWWQNLGSKAAELKAAGITAIWLPPAYKGGSATDVGYGVYDRYDLGEFNQKGTVATRYGTISQLQSAISSLKGQGIQVYEDIVMNHLTWADAQETVNGNLVYTRFNYPGRGSTYSSYRWSSANFTGTQQAPNNGWYQWKSWDFQPYANNDAYDNLLGSEIQYNGNPANQTETINWGNWLTTKLQLDGYRLDATKHIYTPYVNQWLDAVKGTSGRFAVSEAWFRNLQELRNYAAATGGRTSLFDVPLHYTFQDMSNGNGAWDMRGLQFAGFTESNPTLSVSFVDNHDTDHQGGALYSPVVNLKMLAYAYILTRANGYPCVYYRDYYEYGLGPQIKQLIDIRRANGYGAGAEYTSANDADVYAYSRAGDGTRPGLLLLLNDGSTARTKTLTTPFKNATLTDKTGNRTGTVTTDANGTGNFPVNARSYSVWVPGSGSTTPPPPSTTTTAVTFQVNYSNTVSGQDVYVIGSTAQLGSWNTANAIKLSGAAWPTWRGTINLTSGTAVQYKYIRKDGAGNVLWEGGSNRAFTPTGTSVTRTDTWQ
ncbi:alpha-amylase [Hymenobacter latericus]|uniref:alpha-amylase n=1 Tax=Hymenobacter sp. YIM 151858-1 TaxID=2987688 RepID=UPI002225F6CC|nr:alpha-amylase [Hymenobacter sp. YIM 151858-1]UYZ60518.1 alpha-amylase [Hymenobacter sp. YIM 151858-1]